MLIDVNKNSQLFAAIKLAKNFSECAKKAPSWQAWVRKCEERIMRRYISWSIYAYSDFLLNADGNMWDIDSNC